MSSALWYLLLLTPILAVVYVLWAHRNRAAEREAASKERLTALVGIVQADRAAAVAIPNAGAARPVAAKPLADSSAPAAPPRFLSQPETLAYYLLKAGLPGYEIFARVSLAFVTAESTGLSTSAPAERWPMRSEVDFVICDKNMQVIAAVQLDGRPGRRETPAVAQRLGAAGIRVVRIDAGALPRREQVRSLILGQPA